MKKKLMLSVLVLGVLATSVVPSVANAAEVGAPDQNQEVLTRGIPVWAKVAWKITKKVSNGLYNISPEITTNKYGVTTSPGSIEFNGKKYGTSASHDIQSASTKHSVAFYTMANAFLWGTNYSLIVINPHGNKTINTSVKPGVYRGFKFGLTGKYVAHFVLNNKVKMAPYIAYRNDDANSGLGTHGLINGSHGHYDRPQLDSEVNGGQSAFTTGYGDLNRPSWRDKFTMPSSEHISVADLVTEVQDGEQPVFSTKHYLAGDMIHIKDTVDQVIYNAETNETSLTFASGTKDSTPMRYHGDLRFKLKSGDEFAQDMSVEQLGDNPEFRLPDYLKYLVDHDSHAPEYKVLAMHASDKEDKTI